MVSANRATLRKPALPQLAAQPSAAVRQRTTLLPDAAFRVTISGAIVPWVWACSLDDDDGNGYTHSPIWQTGKVREGVASWVGWLTHHRYAVRYRH